ncbi:MAG: phenylalanine--tRNA ligase subunit beta [Candidatus Omnitrophica bacterium]|nr:phenylalanine--tRNA ligase subunit beta [Candidatus Omnitrophota bacterium]
MKISYKWLKEYIDFKEPPEKIAEMLTASGSEVKSIDAVEGGDHLMEIEITPNRSDCLSYIGMAREVSALTGRKIKIPPMNVKARTKSRDSGGTAPFTVEIKDKDLCPRYTARLIMNITVKESPEWLKKKIALMGLRPVNNVVDITNFVLFETGQPMHAFDCDKIKGQRVVIRRAGEAEKIISIDNVERTLEKNMLVIADAERPIAVAGVMGGLDTEVNFDTRNVLLESAYFTPVSIRRTSYKLALMSESSYRFERNVDPEMVLPASGRAALLIKELCGGYIAGLVDKGEKPAKDRTALFRIDRINKLLNLKLTEGYIEKALSRLSFDTVSRKKDLIKITIPSFRQDIKDEVDIVEEVARLYGYENMASTIPSIVPNPERRPLSWQIKEQTAETLISLGLSEVITYGLMSRASLHKAFGYDIPEAIAVKNYLSVDQEIMRPSLVPGVLGVLSRNTNRSMKDLKIFEIGNVYRKDYHYEAMHLCIALSGIFSDDWQRQKTALTLFDLKGVLDVLFSKLGLSADKIEITTDEQTQSSGMRGKGPSIFYDKKYLGYLTAPDKKTLDAFDLTEKVFVAEINLDALKQYVNLRKKFKGIPKYPSIRRDISLIAPESVAFGRITTVVGELGGKLVENIELLDRYSGKQIPEGHQGLSFRIEYRDRAKTLTSEEVDRVHFAIRDSLVKKLGVVLR